MHDSVRTEKSELTYKSLPDNVLIFITTCLHVSILILAIIVPSIENVFEVVGSFACVCIAYVFPACGYLMALDRYGTEEKRARTKTKILVATSWFYLFFGISYIIFFFIFLALKFSGVVPKAE